MSIERQFAKYARFETKRMILRPFSYKDADNFYQIVSNSENLLFLFPAIDSKGEAKELLVQAFLKKPLGKWAIVDKESRQMIGAFQIEKLEKSSLQAEIGYFLRKDYWNQGLMTEVLTQFVNMAFDKLGLRELRIVTHIENVASQQVAKKAGFIKSRSYKGSDRYTHKMRQYQSFIHTSKLNKKGTK